MQPEAWGFGLEAWTWGHGPETWGLGPGTWDLGPGAWGVGPRLQESSILIIRDSLCSGFPSARSFPYRGFPFIPLYNGCPFVKNCLLSGISFIYAGFAFSMFPFRKDFLM